MMRALVRMWGALGSLKMRGTGRVCPCVGIWKTGSATLMTKRRTLKNGERRWTLDGREWPEVDRGIKAEKRGVKDLARRTEGAGRELKLIVQKMVGEDKIISEVRVI
mmetsp:Transcript_52463/g.102663  ORF Transcript_52463/g.102663 Transcript_52463/m.102663 type:complete len:107 (+) Transcript_52463:355-675(+)